ncbi:hypothetical protein [Streptomyces sp. NPDC085540]|uniref:hypothetical protein n=1 Tax=Streptomyces sp. NPDC085540 TaxID=3365730 RepID=UPI0037D8BCD8
MEKFELMTPVMQPEVPKLRKANRTGATWNVVYTLTRENSSLSRGRRAARPDHEVNHPVAYMGDNLTVVEDGKVRDLSERVPHCLPAIPEGSPCYMGR